MTKVDEHYTRFVDAFDQIVDKNKIDWRQELKTKDIGIVIAFHICAL